MMQVNRRHLAAATSLVSLLTVAVWAGTHTAGAAEQGAASCGANLKDQSKAVGKEPTPDEQGRVFPLVTIHGITGLQCRLRGCGRSLVQGLHAERVTNVDREPHGQAGCFESQGVPTRACVLVRVHEGFVAVGDRSCSR